ncbi:DUF7342 family protein [Natronorubrum tibetense]|nr:hypothetical protein [Natronorubrum tibetense]
MDSGPDELQSAIENPFDEGSIEARLYNEILRRQSPFTIADLAARTECDPAGAREYIQSFVSLGVVIKHSGDPPTYERNDAYFEWDTVKALAQDHSLAELESRIESLLERIQTYQERYDADTPETVDQVTVDAKMSRASVDADLNDWTNTRAKLRRYKRARQIRLGRSESTCI